MGKEVVFMWFIWHEAMAVNEWRALIALASISKQCVCCRPNTSEFVKHKFWDCIQAWRAWRWATLLCMNSAGLELAVLIVLIGNKLFLGKDS